MKTLIVYFSRTGENAINGAVERITKGYTEIVAEKIARYTSGDLFKLEPLVAYPENYNECVKRANEERSSGQPVEFKNPMDNLDEYNVIYVGFPNWYRSYPRIVATFLRKYSFLGKTIKPFCTNEEGEFGIGELELRSTVKGAICKDGFAVNGHDADKCDDALLKWINK